MNPGLYTRTSGVPFTVVGDDVVALHVDNGHGYLMEGVTASIWQLLSQPSDMATICAQLMTDYDVDATRCEAEVRIILREMHQEGLLQLVPAG